ncbi:MAG: hypothetical protein GY853_01320 [PVC group bacterium]|nr:hypothetical protein [PVC group bacterium]
MKLSKKIGVVGFAISEIILLAITVIGIMKVWQDKESLTDLVAIAYAQTGILAIVWGSVGAVSYAKNRGPKTVTNPFKDE